MVYRVHKIIFIILRIKIIFHLKSVTNFCLKHNWQKKILRLKEEVD